MTIVPSTQSQQSAKLFVQGKNLVEKIEDISLDDMEFAKDNPRISQHGKNLSQKEIGDILFEQEDGRTLKKQIFIDGQQYDEPYVRKEGSKYVVEEGNRRTTAMKSILADIRDQKITGISEKEFSKIRCKILKPTATKAEIRKFLASIHISGKKDWPARNKGETISLMIDLDGETYLSIADHLGRSKNEIEKYYQAYKMSEEYSKRYSGVFMRTYSHWHEFYRSANLQKQAQSDPGFRDTIMELVHDRKITEHKQMRKLAEIYSPTVDPSLRKKALDELEKPSGNMIKAYEVFVDYSDKGSLALICKAKKLIDTIKVSSLQKTYSQGEIPDAIDLLIASALDVKKTLSSLMVSSGSAAL